MKHWRKFSRKKCSKRYFKAMMLKFDDFEKILFRAYRYWRVGVRVRMWQYSNLGNHSTDFRRTKLILLAPKKNSIKLFYRFSFFYSLTTFSIFRFICSNSFILLQLMLLNIINCSWKIFNLPTFVFINFQIIFSMLFVIKENILITHKLII